MALSKRPVVEPNGTFQLYARMLAGEFRKGPFRQEGRNLNVIAEGEHQSFAEWQER